MVEQMPFFLLSDPSTDGWTLQGNYDPLWPRSLWSSCVASRMVISNMLVMTTDFEFEITYGTPDHIL